MTNRAPRGPVPKVKTHFTLDPEVLAAVQKMAAEDDRSTSYLVNKILKENLNANGYKRSV